MRNIMRAVTGLVITGFICIFIMAAMSYYSVSSVVRQEVGEKIGNSMVSTINSISDIMELQASVTDTLATEVEHMDFYNRDELTERFRKQVARFWRYHDVGIGYPDGTAVYASGFEAPDGWYSAQRPWYVGAASYPGRVYVTWPYLAADGKGYIVSFSKAIVEDGLVLGVVTMEMTCDELDKIINHSSGLDGYSFLMNEQGRFISHPREDLNLSSAKSDDFLITGMMDRTTARKILRADGEVFIATDIDGEKKFFFSKVIPSTGWVVCSVVPITALDSAMNILIRNIAISAAVLGVFAFAGALWFLPQIKYGMTTIVRARESAEAADRSKSDFIATVSHEIRTPMNAIMGMSEMMLADSLSASQRLRLLNIKSASSMLLTIINDLLDISKAEANKLEIVEVPYSPSSLINDMVGIIYSKMDEKDILMVPDISPSVPARLLGDDVRIRQIMINLLSNAVKFTSVGRIVLFMDYRDGHLIFGVSDTGMGIKKEALPRIFDVFLQLDSKRNRHIQGTGLGLAISKRLTDLMHGKLTVESEYGAGSTFTLSVPQKALSEEPMLSVPDAESKVVLLVCNSPEVADVLTTMSARLGVKNVQVASCLQEVSTLAPYTHIVCYVRGNMSPRPFYEMCRWYENKKAFVVMDMGSPWIANVPDQITLLFRPLTIIGLARLYSDHTDESWNRNIQDIFRTLDTTVLVVDDSAVNAEVAKGLLQRYSINADIADSGQAAIDMVQRKEYDIVFMDHMMPGMDGAEATRAIRALGGRYSTCVIVALTANTTSTTELIDSGMNDYISKPIVIKHLTEMLRKWLPPGKVLSSTVTALRTPSGKFDRELEKLMDVDGLDVGSGVGLSGDDPAMYLGVVETFIGDYHTKEEPHSPSELYCIWAHSMKSALRQIGANELGERAEKLERAAKSGDTGYIAEKGTEFSASLAQLVNQISNTGIWETSSNNQIYALDRCLANFDDDGARHALLSLSGILPEATRLAVEKALYDFDFDSARAALNPDNGGAPG